MSIKQSLFHDQCKIAKLKPLFKKGSKSDPKNCRPISLLHVVPKIIEKIIQISDTRIFRLKWLTLQVSIRFLCEFFNWFLPCSTYRFYYERNGQRMILVDLQKAFDTSDHTFLQKMEYMGFKESIIKWFQSCLWSRKFFVALENVFSDAGLIHCVVPQGSLS